MRAMGLGTHLPVYTEIQPGGPEYETALVFQQPIKDKGVDLCLYKVLTFVFTYKVPRSKRTPSRL
jgi:hypothetical protein